MTRRTPWPKVLTLVGLGVLAATTVIALFVILGVGGGLPGARPLQAQASGPIGTGWQNYDLIVSPGDWDGARDGAPDIIARKVSDGSLWLFPGNGRGGYTGPTRIGSGFHAYTQLVAAGNFTGHQYPDLMAVRNDGELILFPNLGHGVLGKPVSLGPGWGGYSAVVGADNFNGDHLPGIIVRDPVDGLLTLFKGDGHGGFSGHSLIASVSFSSYSLLAVPGDWDNGGYVPNAPGGVGYADLVGRSPDGTLCLFRGNGRGGLQNTSCIAIGSGWGAFNAIVTPGTWEQGDQIDLLARTPEGSLWLATGAGISGYTDPLSIPQCVGITLYVSSLSPSYSINFERFGQATPQSVATLTETDGKVQVIPPNASRDGAGWQPSASYSATCSWSSGLYAAQLKTTAPVGTTAASIDYTSYATFVVRPLVPPPTRQLLVVASTNTWNAYNDWPQNGSFYSATRPTQASYLRPDPDASPLFQGSHLAGGELLVLQWLAAHHFAYQLVSDVDLNDSPWMLSTSSYYAVVLSTHSEYWTDAMYDAVAKYLQDGGSVLSLSGNTAFREEKLVKPQGATWSSLLVGGERSFRPLYSIASLLGLEYLFTTHYHCAPYRVLQPTSWLMAGVKAHIIGSQGKYWERGCINNSPGVGAGASGDEVDQRPPFLLSREYEVVAQGTNEIGGRADLVWYLRRNGGQIVNVGSISFGNSLAIDVNLSRIVINALTEFQRFHDSGQTSFGGLVAAGDWDGDGHPDLLARSGDSLYLFRGNGSDGWLVSRFVSSGWAQYDLIASAGDWTGQGRPDLFARRASDGALFVMPSNGDGGFEARFRIGSRIKWSSYDTIMGVGAFDGHGISDLIARTPSGSIYLYTGSGHGQVDPTPRLLATGWDAYDQIVGPVDWNGDGLPDLIARKPDGSMWIALGRRDHTLATPQQMQGMDGWDEFSTIVGAVDWSSRGHQDLLARKADGSLWLFYGKGATSFDGSREFTYGWNSFS